MIKFNMAPAARNLADHVMAVKPGEKALIVTDSGRSPRITEALAHAIAGAGEKCSSAAKPMDNTDLDLYWRRDVVSAFVGYALREIRGDDMRAIRYKIARQAL